MEKNILIAWVWTRQVENFAVPVLGQPDCCNVLPLRLLVILVTKPPLAKAQKYIKNYVVHFEGIKFLPIIHKCMAWAETAYICRSK